MSRKQPPNEPPKDKGEFDEQYEHLTPPQKEVLFRFLAGNSDEEISKMLHCSEPTVRYHIGRVVRVFGLVDEETKGYRSRNDLEELFIRYRPERVCDKIKREHGYAIAPAQALVIPVTHQKNSQPSLSAPQINPDSPGRSMALTSTFYVKPHCLDRCYEEITRPGQLVRIRAPQMMGKTSLLYRMLNHAETEGYHTLSLNLRYDLDEADLGSLATFLQWFCRNVAERLNLPLDSLPTTKQDCTSYLQQQVLPAIGAPLAIALDEAEVLFEYPTIAREFFGLLRGWHEKAKRPRTGAIWENLRLIVAHSTDDYIGLGVAQSPFQNIGYVEQLQPLTAEQIHTLAKQYNLQWTKGHNQQIWDLVGGHPFLVQQALYSLWRKDTTWTDFLAQASTLTGIYRSHLQTLLARLQSPLGVKAGLSEALSQVIQTPETAKLTQEQIFKLAGLGLIQLQGNRARISCNLYQQFFQHWC